MGIYSIGIMGGVFPHSLLRDGKLGLWGGSDLEFSAQGPGLTNLGSGFRV